MKQATTHHTLRLVFDSDWHVGDGAGQPGYIDQIIRRHPQDELPYVPAKTLTGIWRDACEQVTAGLDRGPAEAGNNTNWRDWVDWLFGDQPNQRAPDRLALAPLSAHLSVREGRFPATLRQLLNQQATLRQALTFIKPGIKIDPRNGQALDDHLRFVEMVRVGAVLEAEVTVAMTDCTETQRQAALALLRAGAQVVERLGGNRRRGAGKCCLEFIVEGDPVTVLAQAAPPLPEQRPVSRDYGFAASGTPIDTGPWLRIPLVITPTTPVLITHHTVGNVVESLDFIPGSYLLGALTERLQAHAGESLFPWIARGDIQVAHAYLELQQRGLPVPLALYFAKEEGGLDKGKTVWNRFYPVDTDKQLKPQREGYVGKLPDKGLPAFGKVELQTITHSTIDDEPQRPTEAVGGVYTYEAISTIRQQQDRWIPTRLRSELRLPQTLAQRLFTDSNWWQALTASLQLGKARKDDYGQVQLEAKEPHELTVVDNGAADITELTIWLLSDLLIRGERLQPAPTVAGLQRLLETALGKVKLEPCADAFVRTRRTDSWHTVWGLPRLSYMGLAAGSCVRFKLIEGTVSKAMLERLECQGLGERRAEGYGEVRFDPDVLKKPLIEATEAVNGTSNEGQPEERDKECDAGAAPPAVDQEVQDFVATLERAAWREAIERAATRQGYDSHWRCKTLGWTQGKGAKPSNAQLGRLRDILQRLTPETGENTLTQWANQVEKGGKEKWPEASRERFREIAADPLTQVWQLLDLTPCPTATGAAPPDATLPFVSPQQCADLQVQLWPEALRCLLFAAIRAEQREREFPGEYHG